MKNFTLVAMAAALAGSLFAGPAENPQLEAYLAKTMTACPGAQITLETVDVKGPKNFDAYRISMTSVVESCRERTYALHSPATGQILSGQIIPLEKSMKSATTKVQEFLEKQMNPGVEVRILDEKLDDGLRRVKIAKPSPSGPVTMYGYVDESENFFMMGRRGNVSEDPKDSLFEQLKVEDAAATRGARTAKIEILELSDFQCPACRSAHQILEPYVEKYGDRIHYMRLDMPITDFHDWAMNAALGARAIQKLAPKHYWPYVDYIFKNQPNITAESIDLVVRDFVEGIGLDWKTFRPHYESPNERDRLNRQTGTAFENSIFATPTIFINGRTIFYGEEASGLRSHLKQIFGEELSSGSSH